jgi:hypothetical protein
MALPTAAEIAALDEAGPLLRFAAEHVDQLDPSLSLAIAASIEAGRSQQWTPEIAQKFWVAFAALCKLIRPVTMDCLAAARRDIPVRSWVRFWRRGQCVSIAERTSSRYMILLFALLFVATPMQFYVWVCSNLVKQLDAQLTSLTAEAAPLAAEYAQVPVISGAGAFTTEQKQQQEKLNQDATAVAADACRVALAVDHLDRMTLLKFYENPAVCATSALGGPSMQYEFAAHFIQLTRTAGLRIESNANLISGIILSFVLPILLGAIGAVAYVIRMISEQIKSTTFSGSSPTRHVMRTMLGALMGVVVGLFSGLSSQLSLPPLALAFLAGYGVEAVFSMFDGLVERFRQPAPTASRTATAAKPAAEATLV